MNNSSHLLINSGFWLIIIYSFFPIHYYSNLVREFAVIFVFSFFWLYLGNYTPDLDNSKTRIIPRFSLIDQKFRLLFIEPIQKAYNSFEHREISHSFNGLVRIFSRIIILVLMVTLIGVCVQILLFYHDSLIIFIRYMLQGREIITPLHFFDAGSFFIFLFLFSCLAYVFGYFGHLWVDSITIKGINWIYRNLSESKKSGQVNKKQVIKREADSGWRGYIRTGTINENNGVRYFLIVIILLYFSLIIFLPTVPLQVVQSIFPILSILLFIGLGFLFRNEKFARYFLVQDLCEICKRPMILRMSSKRYGEKVYWDCTNCNKTFDAPQDLKLEKPEVYFSRKMPYPLFIFLDILLGIILLLSFIIHDLLFPVLAIVVIIFNLILQIGYQKRENRKKLLFV